jgi:hypothetical protein
MPVKIEHPTVGETAHNTTGKTISSEIKNEYPDQPYEVQEKLERLRRIEGDTTPILLIPGLAKLPKKNETRARQEKVDQHIYDLLKAREYYRTIHFAIPSLQKLCRSFNTNKSTIKRNDPELVERWPDINWSRPSNKCK